MAPNRRVLIVLPERVHLMDVVGPAQVFTSAAEAGAGYALSYVAERPGTETHQGLGLTVPTSWPALGEGDLVIVLGWRARAGGGGSRRPVVRCARPALLALGTRRSSRLRVRRAFALAEAGLLEGRTATTRHDLTEVLARGVAVSVCPGTSCSPARSGGARPPVSPAARTWRSISSYRRS